MATGKITKRTLDALQAGGVTGFLWDDDLKGFGLKISAGGSASYVVQYRMGGREAKTRRYTIGGHGSPWTPFTAREEATRLFALSIRASTRSSLISSDAGRLSIWRFQTTPIGSQQAARAKFLDADIVVIGAGFYNFTIPSQLKAWIDRIAVRGRTFTYSENGPVGLAKGKRIITALARGNVYGEGSPYTAYEHAETLLRTLFGFVGTDVDFVIAEGLGRGEEARRAAIDVALEQARQVSMRLAA